MPGEIIIYKAALAGTIDDCICRSFLDIAFCKEIMLQPLQVLSLSESGDHQLMVLPIIGGVDIREAGRDEFFIGAEQFYWNPDNPDFCIVNPYSENEISCLVIGCKNAHLPNSPPQTGTIDLAQKNKLINIADHHYLKFSIGIYDGRQDDLYNAHLIARVYFVMCSGVCSK